MASAFLGLALVYFPYPFVSAEIIYQPACASDVCRHPIRQQLTFVDPDGNRYIV